MTYRKLPEAIADLLLNHNSPPRLVAHLTLVHEVAIDLVEEIHKSFPFLVFDKEAVLLGAASHDIGKAKLPAELTGGGSEH